MQIGAAPGDLAKLGDRGVHVRRPGAIWDWVKEQRNDLARDALVGFAVLIAGFMFAMWWEGRLADRSEIQENTRFVRQVAIAKADLKPFSQINPEGRRSRRA
jgi:hypothetical protein